MIKQLEKRGKIMSNAFKDDFIYHWGLATYTLKDYERVIANE